jgi:hypothetical protein
VTRQLRALVLIIALALVAGISSYLTTISARDAPDPRPLPALADGLSPAATIARQEFADRVRTRFPIGSAERALMLELWFEGFQHPGDASKQWASLDRHGPPCARNWTVTWATDDSGHLTAIDGTYIPSC